MRLFRIKAFFQYSVDVAVLYYFWKAFIDVLIWLLLNFDHWKPQQRDIEQDSLVVTLKTLDKILKVF